MSKRLRVAKALYNGKRLKSKGDALLLNPQIIDKINQHLLDNVKKCVDQDGVVVKFISTGHNFAGPLTKRIKDHANMETVMSSRPVTF